MRSKHPVHPGVGEEETESEVMKPTLRVLLLMSAKVVGNFKYREIGRTLVKERMFLVALVQAVFTQIFTVLTPVVNTGASEEQTLDPVCRRRKNWLPYNGDWGIDGPVSEEVGVGRFLLSWVLSASQSSPLPSQLFGRKNFQETVPPTPSLQDPSTLYSALGKQLMTPGYRD